MVMCEPLPLGLLSFAISRQVLAAMVMGPAPTHVLATMLGPSVERVKLNEPPAFPVLHTMILPVTASGAGVAVTAPTANVAVGTAAVGVGSIGESEHAARNATPSPAPAMSATLFICISF